MEIRHFRNAPPMTPFAPQWSYYIAEASIADEIDIPALREIILAKERELQRLHEPAGAGGTGLGPDSMTARFVHYNLFAWSDDVVQETLRAIRRRYVTFLDNLRVPRRSVKIKAWANVMRRGEQIAKHRHSFSPWSYLGGHLTVACEATSTSYVNPYNDEDVYAAANEPGKLTLFSHHVAHWTDTHAGAGERITIAFDLVDADHPKLFNGEPVCSLAVDFDGPERDAVAAQ